MRKLAITYYYNLMSNHRITDITIHESGVKAVEWIVKESPKYFQIPPIWKKQPKLTSNGVVTAGFGHRKVIARFLTPEEIDIYNQYGDKTFIDYTTQLLIAPPEKDETNDG